MIDSLYENYIKTVRCLQRKKLTKLSFTSLFAKIFINLIRVGVAKILYKKEYAIVNGDMGISWSSVHKKNIIESKVVSYIIDIDNIVMNKSILEVFKKVNIINFKQFIFFLSRGKTSELLYKLNFLFEYYLFKRLIVDSQGENVFISGHFDRYVILISHICQNNNKKLIIIQHGAFEELDCIPSIYVSKVIYMYECSVQSMKKIYFNNNEVNYMQGDRQNDDFKSFIKHDFENKINILYVTQDVNSQYNIQIILETIDMILSANLDIKLYIKSHPRDQTDYALLEKKYNFVCIVNQHYQNYNVIISRYSTLAYNYHLHGYKTIFINVEKIKMDFFNDPNVLVLTRLKPLKNILLRLLSDES